MYRFSTPLLEVTGIGPSVAEQLKQHDLHTVLDFLLWLPLRYEDRSRMVTIKEAQVGELVTLIATVRRTQNYYKGRRSIQSATVFDETGKLTLLWFNNSYIIDKLKENQQFFISGKVNDRRVMVQPTVESVSADTIHTARLVPIYSKLSTIKQGSLRRLLKHIVDHLEADEDTIRTLVPPADLSTFPALQISTQELFQILHFPDQEERVVLARERLALEELLELVFHSQHIKKTWQQEKNTFPISIRPTPEQPVIPSTIPFTLTKSQQRATAEILEDLQAPHPMNRLLLGDVGSGKTVVAGIAMHHVIQNGFAAALIAPTQILAEQHAQTLQKLFPSFPITLLTSKTAKRGIKEKKASNGPAAVYVGTHSVIHRLAEIKPALIIYDEQHRFGVSQRSFFPPDQRQPNVLTMSATPIPRSLLLTLFSHLSVSQLNELPPGRKPVKSWLVPARKKESSWDWLANQTRETGMQLFVVCPFIDPSESAEFEHVAAASSVFEKMAEYFAEHFPELRLGLLHGKMSAREKTRITQELYAKKIDILVTTPVIEVGLDVPNAGAIVIESSERFGLASLHQLRGRVGRGEQQAYCLLFTSKPGKQPRLEQFALETNGLKLAELDLQRRGAGDLFGTQQSGFDTLKFANWTNFSVMTQARQLFDLLEKNRQSWQPLLPLATSTNPAIAAN